MSPRLPLVFILTLTTLISVSARMQTAGSVQAQASPTRIAVKSGSVTLEAWMWRPQGSGPFPAVLVNHGSGRTREELKRLGPYERLAETIGPVFARHGYVLLYLFRRGVGPSINLGDNAIEQMNEAAATHGQDARNALQMKLLEGSEMSDAVAALTRLRQLPDVDPLRVALIGHSFGGWVGAWSVHNAGFRPKLFIGIGADAELAKDGPPLLMLFGRFDYFGLQAPTNAQVVISPWSEHILEFADPVLVNAGVKAACATVGKPVPAAPTAWLWRFTGLVLGIAGALVLVFRLPELHPRLARTRRYLVPAVLLIALGLTLGPWLGVTPQLRRIPRQLVLLPVIWLALAGLNRLRLPRWSLAVATGILALACLAIARHLALSLIHI